MRDGIEQIGHLRFRQRPGPASVANVVACVWRAATHTDTTLRLVPDGCVELVRSATGQVQIFGAATRWRDVSLAAGADHDGVRLRAGAAAAILRVDQRTLVDRVVAAEALDLPAELSHAIDRHRWFTSLWPLLAERADEGLDPVAAAVVPLLARPSARVGALAGQLGVGERRLRRRFEYATGLAPTMYRRLARLNAALAAIADTQHPIADLAHRFGYADQAHLNREVVTLTSRTPGAFRT